MRGRRLGGALGNGRGIATLAQREQHARRSVQRRVQAAGHGNQHDDVDDQLGIRHANAAQHGLVGTGLGQGRVVPWHQGHHQEDRHQVEQADTPDHRVGGAADLLARVLRLGSSDGDDFSTHEREHGSQHGGQHGTQAVRHEALGIEQVAGTAHLAARYKAEHGCATYGDEADDRQHLEQGEPELELAVVLHAAQVGQGQCQGNDEGERPQVNRREPGMQDGGGGVGLQRDHEYPEPPVQPANGKTGPAPDGAVGIGRERTGVGRGDRHFTQHAHHQHDQRTGSGVSQQHGRAGRCNGVAGAYEQAGTDDASDGQHGDMPLFEPLSEVIGIVTAH